MKTQGSFGGANGGGGKRGCMNPFALPIKKRFNAAAKNSNMMDVSDDGQQPCGEMKQSAALSSTIAIALQDSSSSSTTTTAKKKKYRKPQCSHPSCPNRVMNQGVCARHGARVRTCSIPDCTKYAQKGGVCIRHGAVKEYKRCLVGGCKSRPVGKEGVCARHVGVSFGESGVPNLAAADTAGQEQQQLAQDEERQDVITTNVVHNEQQSQQRQLQHQAREQPPNAQQEAAVPTSTTIKRPITSNTNTTIPFKSQSSKKK
eukprot:scaffold14015_cov88-Skeletonema_marinoi.AAC.1